MNLKAEHERLASALLVQGPTTATALLALAEKTDKSQHLPIDPKTLCEAAGQASRAAELAASLIYVPVADEVPTSAAAAPSSSTPTEPPPAPVPAHGEPGYRVPGEGRELYTYTEEDAKRHLESAPTSTVTAPSSNGEGSVTPAAVKSTPPADTGSVTPTA